VHIFDFASVNLYKAKFTLYSYILTYNKVCITTFTTYKGLEISKTLSTRPRPHAQDQDHFRCP